MSDRPTIRSMDACEAAHNLWMELRDVCINEEAYYIIEKHLGHISHPWDPITGTDKTKEFLHETQEITESGADGRDELEAEVPKAVERGRAAVASDEQADQEVSEGTARALEESWNAIYGSGVDRED